jgi:hypothetical protein
MNAGTDNEFFMNPYEAGEGLVSLNQEAVNDEEDDFVEEEILTPPAMDKSGKKKLLNS